jgi:hypothetical protein
MLSLSGSTVGEAPMRKAAPRIFPTSEKADRERRKKLWLDPLFKDLATPDALQLARQCHVSLRLVGEVAGLIVNLNSFLDVGRGLGEPCWSRRLHQERQRPADQQSPGSPCGRVSARARTSSRHQLPRHRAATPLRHQWPVIAYAPTPVCNKKSLLALSYSALDAARHPAQGRSWRQRFAGLPQARG